MKHRWIDRDGFVLENETLPDQGKGDSLLRTMYYFVSQKKVDKSAALLVMIKTLTTSYIYENGVSRHPDLSNKNDTSMDAMIGWILITKLCKDREIFKRIILQLPKQISDKHQWNIFWWDWVKYQSGESKGWLFLASTIFMGIFYWHIWPLKWFGVKSGKYYANYFNVHLAAWMLWSMERKSLLKWLARAFLATSVPMSNALIRKLLGKYHNNTLVYPAKGWKWQRLPWVEYHGIDNSEITREQAGIALDVDVLKYL